MGYDKHQQAGFQRTYRVRQTNQLLAYLVLVALIAALSLAYDETGHSLLGLPFRHGFLLVVVFLLGLIVFVTMKALSRMREAPSLEGGPGPLRALRDPAPAIARALARHRMHPPAHRAP